MAYLYELEIRFFPGGEIAPTMAELREELRARTDPRTMTSIEFGYDGNELHGFPVAVGEQLFLMAIDDWRSVFSSLQKLGKHIIVEREYEPEFFRIGVIERVEEGHIILRHYDADSIWQEPARIEYREITSVTFDDRYVNVFSRYLTHDECAVCEECKSTFLKFASQTDALCPECAHVLYGYPNCEHDFRDGRCVHCHWDGSRSRYIKTLLNKE